MIISFLIGGLLGQSLGEAPDQLFTAIAPTSIRQIEATNDIHKALLENPLLFTLIAENGECTFESAYRFRTWELPSGKFDRNDIISYELFGPAPFRLRVGNESQAYYWPRAANPVEKYRRRSPLGGLPLAALSRNRILTATTEERRIRNKEIAYTLVSIAHLEKRGSDPNPTWMMKSDAKSERRTPMAGRLLSQTEADVVFLDEGYVKPTTHVVQYRFGRSKRPVLVWKKTLSGVGYVGSGRRDSRFAFDLERSLILMSPERDERSLLWTERATRPVPAGPKALVMRAFFIRGKPLWHFVDQDVFFYIANESSWRPFDWGDQMARGRNHLVAVGPTKGEDPPSVFRGYRVCAASASGKYMLVWRYLDNSLWRLTFGA
ncbi:MAG: hypothetical protein ACR2HJ_03585 [Fimbriimonadales bacterium]